MQPIASVSCSEASVLEGSEIGRPAGAVTTQYYRSISSFSSFPGDSFPLHPRLETSTRQGRMRGVRSTRPCASGVDCRA